MTRNTGAQRLIAAERSGLRLAILCRTIAVGLAFLWFASWTSWSDGSPSLAGLICLGGATALGVAHLLVIGGPLDRPWLKYAIYALDCAGLGAAVAFAPLYGPQDVAQVLVYRSYGIYYLFPLLAMSALSLSPRLVLWTGFTAAAAWWAAFVHITSGMDRVVSWRDLETLGYEGMILHPNFAGTGNRIEETALIFIAAAILALAVARARRVFLAQVAAEAERRRATDILGQFVPEAVAEEILEREAALAPRVTDGAALVLDIADFTSFASGRPPEEVIETLNDFLARAAEAVNDAGGVVISYTGDGLLAAFNAPRPVADPAGAARSAAAGLVEVAAVSGFSIRIGLAAGPLAAGSVGSAARRSYTVYGETVNRAARLEALAKTLGETVLADDAAGSGGRALGPQTIRGIDAPVEVFALTGQRAR